MKWSPTVIDGLFLDNLDANGLLFWYDDTIEYHAELKRMREGK